jgi:hypothetical protein
MSSNGMAAGLAYVYSTDPHTSTDSLASPHVTVEISTCSWPLRRLPADCFTEHQLFGVEERSKSLLFSTPSI